MTVLTHQLSLQTGLPESAVRRIAGDAPARYKRYTIPKKGGGVRQISQPAREVKLLQRALMDVLLIRLPVHNAATAYRQGMSIRDNAERHAQNGPILKMDFKDFFPSITSSAWARYCHGTGIITEPDDISLSTHILFQRPKGTRRLQLAIGAPSSPMLSNAIMMQFDDLISNIVAKDRVVYTRYADDLTFSAERTGYLVDVISNVKSCLLRIDYPNLKLNDEKTRYVTKKYHRSVTGLTLADDGRVTIGRENKRIVRAAVHKAYLNELSAQELQKLSGTVAFINSVEPAFISLLAQKFGWETLSKIKGFSRLPKKNN